ncbi:MAG: FAD-dependent oxidoreductase [Desulfurococcales archaeon]|nr:FAD-dependent oxidoreductase [Desulfurococcales archaeon]
MRVVVIGCGVGGVEAVRNLVAAGVGEVKAVCGEWPPYTRHRLSEILRDGLPPTTASITLEPELLTKAEFVKGFATELRLGRKEVVLDSGEVLSYDSLIIATGGLPFIPPIKGAGLRNALPFYGMSSLKYLQSLPKGLRIVVVGAGLVGLTVASSLMSRGHRVAVFEALNHVLPSVMDEEPAKAVTAHLRDTGVKVFLKSRVEEVMGSSKVEAVRTSSMVWGSDVVVYAAGVKPRISLVEGLGLEMVGKAVRITQLGETSLSGVYALGDAAISYDYVTGKPVYRPLGFIAAHYARLIAEALAGKGVRDRGVIPTIYERVGGLDVIRVGLSASEAEGLGLTVDLRCSKGPAWVECFVREAGRTLVGYELVRSDPTKRNKGYEVVREVKEVYQ